MLRLPFLFKSKEDDQTGCNYTELTLMQYLKTAVLRV